MEKTTRISPNLSEIFDMPKDGHGSLYFYPDACRRPLLHYQTSTCPTSCCPPLGGSSDLAFPAQYSRTVPSTARGTLQLSEGNEVMSICHELSIDMKPGMRPAQIKYLTPPPLGDPEANFQSDVMLYVPSYPTHQVAAPSHQDTAQLTISPRSTHEITVRSPKLAKDSPQNRDRRHRFSCLQPDCDRRFVSEYTLKVHMQAHKAKPRVRFPCSAGCSENFSRQHDRLRHEVNRHGKICEFVCDDCGGFFSTKKTLNNHNCHIADGKVRWVK